MSEPFTQEQEARIRQLVAEQASVSLLKHITDNPHIVNELLTLENTLPRIPGILRRIADRLDAAERLKTSL